MDYGPKLTAILCIILIVSVLGAPVVSAYEFKKIEPKTSKEWEQADPIGHGADTWTETYSYYVPKKTHTRQIWVPPITKKEIAGYHMGTKIEVKRVHCKDLNKAKASENFVKILRYYYSWAQGCAADVVFRINVYYPYYRTIIIPGHWKTETYTTGGYWESGLRTVANWYKALLTSRNDAVGAWNDASKVRDYWLTVGFENTTFGGPELGTAILNTSAKLQMAYNKADELQTADTIFKNVFGIPADKQYHHSGSGVDHESVKNTFINIAKDINTVISDYKTVIGGSKGWLAKASDYKKIAAQERDAAGTMISSAEENRVGLVDNDAVFRYARALFTLGSLGGVKVIVILPGQDITAAYEEYMGQVWKVPASMLDSAKTLKSAAEADYDTMTSAYNNINNTYEEGWELADAPWAVQVQDCGGKAIEKASLAKEVAKDSVNTTLQYVQNVDGKGKTMRSIWNASAGVVESKLALLKNSPNAAEQELYHTLSKYYTLAKTHAQAAGWV